MLARTSLRLPKAAARCISSSTPARVLQQTPSTSSGSAEKALPPVSKGEQAWCDIYGVDYEKQITEALHESPVAPKSAPQNVNYPTAGSAKAQGKADIWNVVFGDKKA